MSDRESHCPFLNKSDVRCGNHFSLTRLGSAFDHCFGCYAACGTYQELLHERLDRRQQQGHRTGAMSHAIPQFVSVRLPHGQAVPASAA